MTNILVITLHISEKLTSQYVFIHLNFYYGYSQRRGCKNGFVYEHSSFSVSSSQWEVTVMALYLNYILQSLPFGTPASIFPVSNIKRN